jgi:hypothetical protein
LHIPKTTSFQIPEDLELFSMDELRIILHVAKTKRDALIRDGEFEIITVAGKRMARGRSVRAFLKRCDNTPSGRSLSAQKLNLNHPAPGRPKAART